MICLFFLLLRLGIDLSSSLLRAAGVLLYSGVGFKLSEHLEEKTVQKMGLLRA